MAFDPLVIHICGVDEVAAIVLVGIQNQVAFNLSDIFAKDLATWAEFVNNKARFRESDYLSSVLE